MQSAEYKHINVKLSERKGVVERGAQCSFASQNIAKQSHGSRATKVRYVKVNCYIPYVKAFRIRRNIRFEVVSSESKRDVNIAFYSVNTVSSV